MKDLIDKQTLIRGPDGGMRVNMKLGDELPKEFVDVVMTDDHITRGEYSVTELIDDPRCVALRKQHPELTKSADERLHSMFGKALHKYFETRLKPPKAGVTLYTEYPLQTEFEGHTISGTCDEIMQSDQTLIIGDIKNRTVFKYMEQDFTDVYWQMQIYRYMYTQTLRRTLPNMWVRCIMFFKDRNRRDASIKSPAIYPPSRGIQLNFPVLDDHKVEKYLHSRLNKHLNIRGLDEPDWPDADPHHTWQKIVAYKILKKGGKRAVKGGVFNVSDYDGNAQKAQAEAIIFAKRKGSDHTVHIHRTVPKRCQRYCPVNEYCSSWQRYKQNNNIKETKKYKVKGTNNEHKKK